MRQYHRASEQSYSRQDINKDSQEGQNKVNKLFKVTEQEPVTIDPVMEAKALGIIQKYQGGKISDSDLAFLVHVPKTRKISSCLLKEGHLIKRIFPADLVGNIPVAALESAVLNGDDKMAREAYQFYCETVVRQVEAESLKSEQIRLFLHKDPRYKYFVAYINDQILDTEPQSTEDLSPYIFPNEHFIRTQAQEMITTQLLRELPSTTLAHYLDLLIQNNQPTRHSDENALNIRRIEECLERAANNLSAKDVKYFQAQVAYAYLTQPGHFVVSDNLTDEECQEEQEQLREQYLELLDPNELSDSEIASLLFPFTKMSRFTSEQTVKDYLGFGDEHFGELVRTAFETEAFNNKKVSLALFYKSENIFNIPVAFEAAGFSGNGTWPREVKRYIDYFFNGWGEQGFDTAAMCARRTHGLSPMEYVHIKRNRPEALERNQGGELDHETLFDALIKETYDDEIIQKQMQVFQEVFGAKNALSYANRPDLSRHDAFFFSSDLVNLQQRSGLNAEEFSRRILQQVAQDNGEYMNGLAHHRFATIINKLPEVDLADVLERASEYHHLERLQELISRIKTADDIFESWKMLKQFADVLELIERSELLEQLQKEKSDKLRGYVERLTFHQNIDTAKVMSFWRTPDKFLDIDDCHTEQEINAVKKPSNYLSLPYLGMRAEHLRDALVEGALDRVQTLPPMERQYHLYEDPRLDPTVPHNLYRFMRSAIGQERQGIPGKARQVKKIFGGVRSFCKKYGVDWKKIWNEEDTMAEFSPEQQAELREIIFDPENGINEPKHEAYRIRLGAKSDPEMVIAGNDTASCMPFGSGKNNVYMFNLNCAQLVCERLTHEGEWRTAAQSVVTIDAVTSRPTPLLIEAYQRQNQHIKDLISNEDFKRLPVVTCDNIEVAKNREGEAGTYIHEAYQRFFTEYLDEHAADLRVDTTRVPIGIGYTPFQLGFQEVDNYFIPLAPMGYSDNVHQKSFLVETGLAASEQTVRTGVQPMQTRDALAAAAIEGKAYRDNATLIENLHGMQNNIIGMEIANSHFSRPNLSFTYRDQGGVPRGYILAYEGENIGRPEVYISDLAADPESKMAGGRLIQSFFDAYVSAYGTEERPFLPIFTNSREKTSFQIINKQMERLAQKAGLQTEMEIVNEYERGGDTFYDVRIFVGQTVDEIATLKTRYAA
ncbi:MAG: hypothetical protein ABH846_03215 [Patescibacteria group bacterium]